MTSNAEHLSSVAIWVVLLSITATWVHVARHLVEEKTSAKKPSKRKKGLNSFDKDRVDVLAASLSRFLL